MDLMNSDFSAEDLTEVLISGWTSSQSNNFDSVPSFLTGGSTESTHVPEIFKSQSPIRNSIGALMRSVWILTERKVCADWRLTKKYAQII